MGDDLDDAVEGGCLVILIAVGVALGAFAAVVFTIAAAVKWTIS